MLDTLLQDSEYVTIDVSILGYLYTTLAYVPHACSSWIWLFSPGRAFRSSIDWLELLLLR